MIVINTPNDKTTEYSKEPLADGRVIYVSRNSRFGTDAVLLADFASPKRIDTAVDLCTGGGIIPLLWLCGDSPREKVTGVEIQPECCALARRSIEENRGSERFEVLECDLREIEKHLPREKFSLVTLHFLTDYCLLQDVCS